jgi:hypothetical protein
MADFHEQIKLIATLRAGCRECDDKLYRANIEKHRVGLTRQRANQRQTVSNEDRDRAIAQVRARMDRLNARIAELRAEERQIADWLAQLSEQQKSLDHLRRNLEALRHRQQEIRTRLAELQQLAPPPADEIKKLQEELERLARAEADILPAIERLQAELNQIAGEEQTKRQKQEELRATIDGLRQELRDLQEQLTEILKPSFRDSQAVAAQQQEIDTRIDRLKSDCGDCEGRLHAAIGDLYLVDPHPRAGVAQLDDSIPFLLLPVKIETIFVPVQGIEGLRLNELWVRIYPDEIAVHTHEKTLTDREVVAGELYWTELVAAEFLRSEKDARRRAAWRHMVELFSGQRAAWVVRQTKPTDFDALATLGSSQSLLDFLRSIDAAFFTNLAALDMPAAARASLNSAVTTNDPDAFIILASDQNWLDRINDIVRTRITGFPTHDLTKNDSWTRAPRTYLLPDRFVLLLYGVADGIPREVVGNLIPDTMFLGPDPMDQAQAFPEKDGTVVYGSSFDWMSDFDKAVQLGMGFRVNLNAGESSNGFAKIVVLGVFLSVDAKNGASLVEELIDNHQFGPKGFSLVRQGTPTNNTERDGSGYSDNDAYDDLEFFMATDPPAFDPIDLNPLKSQTDGRLLADALGIAYTPLQSVQRASQTDVLEARSMNTALFSSTLGYWLKTWMSPLISEQTARQTRSFFTSYVTGRGPLPAIRVGNQPYGVLLTSDFSRWAYRDNANLAIAGERFIDQTIFLRNLYNLLARLEKTWRERVPQLPFVGKTDTDSADVLIDILGLQPTSSQFFQRIGYSDETLRNLMNFKNGGRYFGELMELLIFMPAQTGAFLNDLGISRDTDIVAKMKGLHVLWQHYSTTLNPANLVENKPLSESDKLTLNYVEWLAKSEDTQKIISENFPTKAPSALLYVMLRNAILLQLHQGAYQWLRERVAFDSVLETSLQATTLVGIRAASPNVSKLEVVGARVGIAEPSHPTPAMSIGDWLWLGPSTAEAEAAYLKEQRTALLNLIDTPTARLERCFVEHLDCCNYRLDAWQMGLFAQRLQAQRSSSQPENRKTGIHLGAYGWVESVRPSAKVFLSRDSIPASLRPVDSHPILEEDEVIVASTSRNRVPGMRQGGFVHAPSLNHAAAAALLRNAYLSHANPDQADIFSVNLSSDRVRGAEFVLEGMRNGQPIEALLGYQFERRLHDRTSASELRGDIPVLEFNQFILPYRKAFPFESKEVPQAGTGAPSETVPPFSVVNGLKLIQATLNAGNGFGLASVLSAPELPNATLGAAILEEQDSLKNMLDAVKDLLLAEDAFQLVRGNFDRVAAVSLAQKEANIPHELEVIDTPRGSQFTFTNRVTLHFEILDPMLASSNPWPAIATTPRAIAEPGMNKWIASVIGPAPDKIICEVSWVEIADDGTETPHDVHTVTLADLGLQPIDFVWLVSASQDDVRGATELETRIAFQYRRANSIGDDKTVRIRFAQAGAPGTSTFAQVFPLARHLRSLLLENRALTAQDFLPSSGGKETAIPFDKNNPKGFDQAELRSRVTSALNALTTLADTIDGAASPTIQLVFIHDPANPADDETFNGKLGDAFTKLEDEKLTFTDDDQVKLSILLADAESIHQRLRAVASCGITDAFPPESDLTADSAKASLLARAHRTARRLRRADPKDGVLDRANDSISKATADKSIEAQVGFLLDAGRILFGETFNLLPVFSYHNDIDIATADADRNQLLKFARDATPGITNEDIVDEWLTGLARVRKTIHRWEIVRTLADGFNDVSLEMRPVQIPFRATDSWLAVEFPPSDPNDPTKPFGISRDTLSIAAHGATAFQAGAKQSGILLDDWTEDIPTDNETTGISFRYNQPNATPPQALLLAVTPRETGSWNWDDLVGTLNDTLRRAKQRAVEPELLEKNKIWNVLAPALVSEFSTIEKADVSLDLMGIIDFGVLTEFYAHK